jgi:transposase
MKAYSTDLRQKIIEAYKNQEGSQRELAKRFKVSLSFLQKLLKQYRETGRIAHRERGKGLVSKLTRYTETVEKLVEQKNDATLEELQLSLEKETGIRLHCSNICRFWQKRKLTLKKNAKTQSSRHRKSTKSAKRILATGARD